ncbi:uncharacterized protein [Dermacentor andersoni]|uniref:uncharacterized protein isoform X1 n=1 Tax=Dermacentor andersoni TaxID=34620 RepID=UPI0021557DA0|nr:uncharacterized protein LOC126528260 isoform X1 [Dermacentor andersoni]
MATRKFSAAVVLGAFLLGSLHLVSSQQRPKSQDCYPDLVSGCYRYYHSRLWGDFDGNYDRACRNVTAKYPCHQRLASCPEPVRSNFSRQESGYEALRDLICDRKAFQEYRTASECRDVEKSRICEEQNGANPEGLKKDPANFGCRLMRTTLMCFDEAFTPDCQMSQKAAKAAFGKGQDILLALEGCSSSAGSRFISQLLLLGVATLTLARCLSY